MKTTFETSIFKIMYHLLQENTIIYKILSEK